MPSQPDQWYPIDSLACVSFFFFYFSPRHPIAIVDIYPFAQAEADQTRLVRSRAPQTTIAAGTPPYAKIDNYRAMTGRYKTSSKRSIGEQGVQREGVGAEEDQNQFSSPEGSISQEKKN